MELNYVNDQKRKKSFMEKSRYKDEKKNIWKQIFAAPKSIFNFHFWKTNHFLRLSMYSHYNQNPWLKTLLFPWTC